MGNYLMNKEQQEMFKKNLPPTFEPASQRAPICCPAKRAVTHVSHPTSLVNGSVTIAGESRSG